MKKLLLYVCTALLLLSSILGGCAKQDEPEEFIPCIDYCIFVLDEQEMINTASHIIQGTVSKVKQVKLVTDEDGETLPYIFAYVRVKNTLKGNIMDGDTIIVPLEGDGKTVICKNVEDSGGYSEQGDHVLLFLSEDDAYETMYKKLNSKRYKTDKQVPYKLASYEQGRYWLNNENKILHDKNPSEFALFKNLETVEDIKAAYNLTGTPQK